MALQPGHPAPGFTVTDQDGKEISLSDFKGKKIALYFYPKDDTPGCTAQACNLRDNISALKAAGIQVLGISTDSEKSHKKFETKFHLPFPLLADTEKKLVTDYGVWGEKKFMGRTFMGTNRVTYLINENGVIDHVIEKVDTKDHTAQILNLWK
jgi:peroxiredoxin Q/BCP